MSPAPKIRQLAFRLAVILSLVAAAGGLLIVLGWWGSIPILPVPLPDRSDVGAIGGFALLFGGISTATVFMSGQWRWLSPAAGTVVLVLALWGLVGGFPKGLPLDAAPLSLPSAATFLLLAVGMLSLRATRQLQVVATGVAALCALLVCIYKLVVYAYWFQDPSGRVLLLSMPPQSAALQALLALALLGHLVHRLKKPPGKAPGLVLGSYGLMVVICILGWAHFNHEESVAVRKDAEQLAANLSRVLEEHVYRSFDPIDLVFGEVARQARTSGLGSITESREEWRNLRATAESLPQVSALIILDAQGDFRLFSRQFPPPGGNYSHRDYFEAHKAGATRHLGELVAAGTSGKPIFTYSRRLDDSDGNFAGVVLASLEIGYFQAFYRSLDLGPGAAVGLFRRDGELLMRAPLLPDIAEQDLTRHPIYTSLIHQSPAGTFVGYSPYDGEQKLAYYLASDSLPFVINTVMGMNSVIMPFERRFVQSTGVLALVLALMATMMLVQLRALERTALSYDRVRQSQRFAQGVLDSVSPAIAIVSPTGEIISVNAAWRRFGQENGASDSTSHIGQNYLSTCQGAEGDHAEGADLVAEGLSAVITGTSKEFEHVYPCPGPGGERWYRMKVLPMSDGSGRVVVSHESVTELKQAEAALKTAANTDQLTGLNNRRAVIEQAESHIANARRHHHPLSLLMIDCDHFKKVNDTFGHAGGDEVLRRLAGIIRETCRTGDIFGRLGGEEFVAVLPYTTGDGAKILAERLRQAVEHASVTHDGDVIIFTVSVGVATLKTEMDITEVMKEADQALYHAKANGRNRVAVMAGETVSPEV
ncbi:diguanylate cyclase (GGDEF) domain-containing protein [Marinobacter daqiaonensis]|uniref:diguanylate cyclase n=1 Tax=Marinobacter daqiaonensis TaxID=650891 RepID=A0A1I6HT29_9GAMM|nr:diguanylate cyclase [Marinobacter daqiaonensis]SFR57584.1 diguanylate cyclase (GGDEF) domain-containing protein [Marinobacter daqiaonensis]